MQKRPQTWQTTWAGGRGSSTRCGGGLVWFCTDCSSPSPASARSGVTRPGLRYLQSRKEWSSAGRMNCPPPSPASTRTGVTRTVLRRFQHPQGLEFDKANGLFVAISSIRKDWSFTDCPLPSPTSARIGVRQSARIVRRHLEHPQAVEFLSNGLSFAISSIRKDWSSPKRMGCWSASPASARTGGTRSALRHLQHPQGVEFQTDCPSPSPASTRIGVRQTHGLLVLSHRQHPQGVEVDKANGLFVGISSIRKEWSSTDCPSQSPASARTGVRQSARGGRRHLIHFDCIFEYLSRHFLVIIIR